MSDLCSERSARLSHSSSLSSPAHILLQFDGILEGAGQDHVYATCANEVAESLLEGYNGTIFCYGQVSVTGF